MSINVQQLIDDTKKLSNRLKDDETISDTIINQAKNAQNQLLHMKQFSDEVDVQNEAASQRSQSVLVAGLQKESQHLRELQEENRELRAALDDYQNALELIMSKYRQQVSKLMTGSHSEFPSFYDTAYSQVLIEQSHQIRDMREVMQRAAAVDEEEENRQREIISQLITENKGLREMFNVYKKYGCMNPDPPSTAETSDAPATTAITQE